MKIRRTASADKELRRVGHVAKRIDAKIRQFADDPASLQNNVKQLKGTDRYRLRVGHHRVIFKIEGDIMTILAVRKREDAYD